MVLGRVRADDDDDVRVRARGEGGGDRARADPLEERHHRRRVAKARAVVDVVGAEPGSDHLLDEVRLLVRPLGGAEPGEGASAVPIADAREAGRGAVEGLLPARLPEVGPGVRGIDGAVRGLRRVVTAHKRPGEPVGVRDVVEAEAPLDAEALLVRRPVAAIDGRDPFALDAVRDLTPDPAVRAYALDLPQVEPPVHPRLVHERRLHERPRRTRLHALAAGDAGALPHRVVEVEDDARPVPAPGHADDVVHLHLAARPHAQVALDAGVKGDPHRGMGGVGGGGGVSYREAARLEPDPIRPTPEAGVVLVGNLARGLVGEEELEHTAARVAGALGVRPHLHARRRVADAGRSEDPLALHLHHAGAAVAVRTVPGLRGVTEVRDRHPFARGGLPDGLPGRRRDLTAVQTEGDCLAHGACSLPLPPARRLVVVTPTGGPRRLQG